MAASEQNKYKPLTFHYIELKISLPTVGSFAIDALLKLTIENIATSGLFFHSLNNFEYTISK